MRSIQVGKIFCEYSEEDTYAVDDEKTIVSSNDDQMKTEDEIKSTVSSSIDIKNNHTISPLPSPFSSPFKFQSISDQESSNESSSDYFYEFLPENFHAEQV